MNRKLAAGALILAMILFITATVYVMGISGFILLIALAALFSYVRYVGNTLAKLVIESHEKLHKNDEAIYKRVKSLEGQKK
jgi:fatty acid desaturase